VVIQSLHRFLAFLIIFEDLLILILPKIGKIYFEIDLQIYL